MKTETVHASELNQGDTVLINGTLKTVGRNSVNRSMLVFGVRHTNAMVQRVLWPKWYRGQITGYHAQI